MTSPSRDPVQEARKPFAWVIPGDDNAKMDGWLDARITRDGEFTRPLYTAEDLAALRASLVERVVGKVEGMREHEGVPREPDLALNNDRYRRTGHNQAIDRVLAVLRAELSEGRTK